MGSADLLGTGEAALAAGRWEEARSAFEQALAAARRFIRCSVVSDGLDVLPRPLRGSEGNGPSGPARGLGWRSGPQFDRCPAGIPAIRRNGGATCRTEARSLLSTYFACGDAEELSALFDQAGLTSTVVTSHDGLSRFPSIDAAVATEVESTPLGERITEDVYERIRQEANEMFARFVTDEGRLEFPFDSLVVVGRRE